MLTNGGCRPASGHGGPRRSHRQWGSSRVAGPIALLMQKDGIGIPERQVDRDARRNRRMRGIRRRSHPGPKHRTSEGAAIRKLCMTRRARIARTVMAGSVQTERVAERIKLRRTAGCADSECSDDRLNHDHQRKRQCRCQPRCRKPSGHASSSRDFPLAFAARDEKTVSTQCGNLLGREGRRRRELLLVDQRFSRPK